YDMDLVHDLHGTDDLSVTDDMEDTGPTPGPGAGGVGDLTRWGEAELAQHVRPTDDNVGAVHPGTHPPAGGRSEVLAAHVLAGGLGVCGGGCDDGTGHGVLTVGLRSSRQRQQLALGDGVSCYDTGDR